MVSMNIASRSDDPWIQEADNEILSEYDKKNMFDVPWMRLSNKEKIKASAIVFLYFLTGGSVLAFVGILFSTTIPIIFSSDHGDFFISVQPTQISPTIFHAEILPNNYENWSKISKVPEYPQARVNVDDIYPWIGPYNIKKYKYAVFLRTDENYNTAHNLTIRFDNPDREPPFGASMYVYTTKPNESIKQLPITIQGIGGDNKIRNCTVYINYESPRDLLLEAANQTNQGNFNKSIELIDDAIDINPGDALAWKNKGAVFEMIQENHSGALFCLNESIKLNPNDKEALNIKGIALSGMNFTNSNNESINYSDKAINIDPLYFWAWDTRGLALNNLGRYEEAIQAYNRAIELNNHYAYIFINKGIAQYNLKECNESIQAYEQAIKLEPLNPDARYNKGLTLLRQNKSNEANEAFDEAIRLNYSNLHKAWYSKGLVFVRMGKYKEAIQAFDKAIQLKTDYAIAWQNKGMALKCLGITTEANESFAKAKELGYSGKF
jgi:tetratricopeptide (TPR) repeat protein